MMIAHNIGLSKRKAIRCFGVGITGLSSILFMVSCDEDNADASQSAAQVSNDSAAMDLVDEFSPAEVRESMRPAILNVFSETSLTVKAPGHLWGAIGAGQKNIDLLDSGTGFLLRAGDGVETRIFVVTAAHVVFRLTPEEVTLDGTKIRIGESQHKLESRHDRIRVSGLGFIPTRTLIDSQSDVAIIELRPADIKTLEAELDAWPLEKNSPAVRDVVEVFGFPGTASSLLESARVSDVQRGYFAVNRPMDPGFSGAPVVRAGTNAVIGIVSRSTDRYARIVNFDVIGSIVDRFDAEAIEYQDSVPSS